MTKSEKLEAVLSEWQELSNLIQSAEYAAHSGKDKLIKELRSLKPSKQWLDDHGYSDLDEMIENIEEELSL